MAAAAGLPCATHMPGFRNGLPEALHFMSYIPRVGAHIEFKEYGNIPFPCDTSILKCEDGLMHVPSGPGFGVDIDPGDVRKARPVSSGITQTAMDEIQRE